MPAKSSGLADQAIQPALHFGELGFQFAEIAVGSRRRRRRRLFGGVRNGSDKRRKHAKRLRKSGKIFARQFLQGPERRRGEGRGAESATGLLAEFLLLAGEAVDRKFQVARQKRLNAVAVEANELPEKCDRQQRLPFL